MPVKTEFEPDRLGPGSVHHVVTIPACRNPIGGIARQGLHHGEADNADDDGNDRGLKPPLCQGRKIRPEGGHSAQLSVLSP